MERLSTWSKSLTDSKPLFVFDLDSTITKCELLPLIAESVGLGDKMLRLTDAAMSGNIPFEQNFRSRVELLKEVPITEARAIAAMIPLNMEIAGFIRKHPQRCMILTGNLDVWIAPIIEGLGMQGRCLCSRAHVDGDHLLGISDVLNKAQVCAKFPRPFVAIGDGSNDIGMLKSADIGIAFGGVRKPSDDVIQAADRVITDESELVAYLHGFL